jgi:hypothetical protein
MLALRLFPFSVSSLMINVYTAIRNSVREKSVVHASTGLQIAFATHHRAERTLDRATPKNTGVGG